MPSIFTKTVKRDSQDIPLPPPLNRERQTAISILHAHHRLLTEYIWPDATIQSRHAQANHTTFHIRAPGRHTTNFKATFTNLDDGLSLRREGGPPNLRSITTYWKITKGYDGAVDGSDAARGGELWYLEESAEISTFRLLARRAWLVRLMDVFVQMNTRKVLMLLERIAGGDAEASN